MERNCPCCGNHCPREALKCPRGQRYFGGSAPSGEEHVRHAHGAESGDEIVTLLRKCGHYLHHSEKPAVITCLSAEERRTLTELLNKCYDEWS